MPSPPSRSRIGSIPIFALTARAMEGDRETCVAAGATDSIAKPADPPQRLADPRVWLCR